MWLKEWRVDDLIGFSDVSKTNVTSYTFSYTRFFSMILHKCTLRNLVFPLTHLDFPSQSHATSLTLFGIHGLLQWPRSRVVGFSTLFLPHCPFNGFYKRNRKFQITLIFPPTWVPFKASTFAVFNYWVVMFKQFIHVLHMLCNGNAYIFGLTIDFCTTLLFSSIDAHDKGLYDLPHQWTCNWKLVKFDSISYYHKYFTFSLSQYAYNTTH